MADKTTTLKTKTNDNVYPNVIGDNRKNAFVDSSTITHHLYDQTHKVGFQISNETNIKIQNSLQKPAGLTKTKLVGVGTNGQENIEIGDNLTLTNGKLSATGGGSEGAAFDILNSPVDGQTYTGTITGNHPVIMSANNGVNYLANTYVTGYANFSVIWIGQDNSVGVVSLTATNGVLQTQQADLQNKLYSHFITMIDSSSNVALYITIQNTSETEFTSDTLAEYFAGKKVLANGNLHGSVPTYIAGEGGSIKVYYMNSGDNNINPTPDEYQDLSSFTITDLVTPVE